MLLDMGRCTITFTLLVLAAKCAIGGSQCEGAQHLPPFASHAMDQLDPYGRTPLSENNDHAASLAKAFADRPIDAPFGRPLGGEDLLRGVFTSAPGTPVADLRRFHRLTRALALGESKEVTILVLGGSMTAGHMKGLVSIWESTCLANVTNDEATPCLQVSRLTPTKTRLNNQNVDSLDCHVCAFPARLGAWLAGAYPNTNVTILNEAAGGLNSMASAGMLGGLLAEIGSKVDIAILNFAPNDSKTIGGMIHHIKDATALRAMRVHLEGKVREAHEAIVRQLLLLPRSPAVIELELARGDEGPAGMYQPHADVVARYRLPAFSWHVHAGKLPCEAGGCPRVHPSWPWHQVLADFLAYAWTRVAADAACSQTTAAGEVDGDTEFAHPLEWLPAPLWAPQDGACVTPLSFWDARKEAKKPETVTLAGNAQVLQMTPSLPLPVLSAPWQLGDDSAGNGKPGWWADDPKGGRLSFAIRIKQRLGQHPATDSQQLVNSLSNIGIGFLTSFDPAMGAARLSVESDPPHLAVVVNASKPGDRHSITSFQRLCADPTNTSRSQAPPGVMPLCADLTDPPPDRHHRSAGDMQDWWRPVSSAANRAEEERVLHVDLLPRLGAKRNKFVVRFVSTC